LNPHRHSPESKDETWVSNHHLAQFRISAPVTRSNPNPDSHTRCGPAASQASQRALAAHLECSVLRDRKGTQTGDLAPINLKDKGRAINTRPRSPKPASEVRCCYLVFASIEDMQGSNGAPFSISYRGDTADTIFGYGAGTPNHARTYDTTCPGVRSTPIGCRSSLHWWEVGICPALSERRGGFWFWDTACSRTNLPLAMRILSFEGVRNKPIRHRP
jgi:hypothetical protein